MPNVHFRIKVNSFDFLRCYSRPIRYLEFELSTNRMSRFWLFLAVCSISHSFCPHIWHCAQCHLGLPFYRQPRFTLHIWHCPLCKLTMPIVQTMPFVQSTQCQLCAQCHFLHPSMPIMQPMPFMQSTQCQLCTQCHLCKRHNAIYAHNANYAQHLALCK